MKIRYIIFLVLFFCSSLNYGFIGEDDPLKAFLLKLEHYRENYSQEKVHIHMDKPYYSVGDTIWFKSYIVNAEKNQLSVLSKILYVELINEKDSVKKSLRLPVITGLAWGDFTLSDSLSEGNYRIRAYTNWMRNFDEAYFFDKTIKVGNSLSSQVVSNVKYNFSKGGIKEHVDASITYTDIDGKPLSGKEVNYDIQLDNRNILKGKGVTDSSGSLLVKFTNAQPFLLKSGKITTILKVDSKALVKKTFPIKATSENVDVQFFPESGNLVSNIQSRVAFKAVGADGMSRRITGYISNHNAEKVADFKSEYAGMGSFLLTPLKGYSYVATVKFEDGSEKRVDLPAPLESGYVITIKNENSENLSIKVSVAGNQNPNDEVILVGQSNNVVQYVSKNKPDKNILSATLSKKRFPSGIVQFTLFNSSYQPLAERLVFIRHQSPLNVDVKTEKETYKTREKVKMAFNTDSAGKPVQSIFSLAITNESQIPSDDVNETTIFSNLLLSSDLKGYIETPNYYFISVSPEKDKALDNLMLTQGWRKFEWKNITSGTLPALAFIPETTINISGKVLSASRLPIVGGKVSLLSSRGTGLALDTITDAQGKFNFENLSFNDSTTFIVQARNPKSKKNVWIEIDQIPPQMVTRNLNAASAEINVNQSILAYLRLRDEQFDEMRKKGLLRRSIVLGEVKITDVRPKVKRSDNLNGAGNADAIIVASDLQNCQSLAFCLQGRGGVMVQNGIAYLSRNMYGAPMQLIVDGIPMDASFLSAITPYDVESIEVLKSAGYTAMYGMRGGGGVLIITTKRGERRLSPSSLAPGITTYTPHGYYISKQFYSPDYEVPQTDISEDLRTTVYWAPNILTASDGKASVEFFTADKPGTYKAVIEGMDLNGSLTRQVHRFSVIK